MEKLGEPGYIKERRKEIREIQGLSSRDPRVSWTQPHVSIFVWVDSVILPYCFFRYSLPTIHVMWAQVCKFSMVNVKVCQIGEKEAITCPIKLVVHGPCCTHVCWIQSMWTIQSYTKTRRNGSEHLACSNSFSNRCWVTKTLTLWPPTWQLSLVQISCLERWKLRTRFHIIPPLGKQCMHVQR